LANSIGLIDNDYRGMVICRFKYIWQPTDFFQYRNSIVGNINTDKIYKKGDKIAQLLFEPTVQVEFELVDELSQTQRGSGGFGSTDKSINSQVIPITNRSVEVPVEKNTSSTKNYESKVDILEKWKESSGTLKTPVNYETIIREREKSI